jgi:hypothetical protein
MRPMYRAFRSASFGPIISAVEGSLDSGDSRFSNEGRRGLDSKHDRL